MLLLSLSAALAAPAIPVASVAGANVQRPQWSPDGKRLSFEANFHDEKRIELYVGEPRPDAFRKVEARSRAPSALTSGFQTTTGGGGVVHELAWAPAGIDAYVFSASTDRLDYDLFISEGTALSPGPGADGGARWSRDGRYIAFTSARTGEGDLYLLDTRAIEQPPKQLTHATGSSELYVDWAPDGERLVYVGHSEAGDNLWLLPAIGAEPARLTAWAGNQIRPRFAPTDGRIAFYANREDPARFDLYVVEVGAAPTLLARGVVPDAAGPAWTPDGRSIVFVAEDDANLDPVRVVTVADPTRVATLDVGTVGHSDLALVSRDGKLWLAVVAQGLRQDARRDFKRLFVAEIAVP